MTTAHTLFPDYLLELYVGRERCVPLLVREIRVVRAVVSLGHEQRAVVRRALWLRERKDVIAIDAAVRSLASEDDAILDRVRRSRWRKIYLRPMSTWA
jgi:hypothetical protein